MDTLDELYENGLYAPRLITEVAVPEWANLIEYRDPITGIFAVLTKDIIIRKICPAANASDVYSVSSLTLISDTDAVDFFTKCLEVDMFAIVYTGAVKINILVATRVLLSSGAVGYKVLFVATSSDINSGLKNKINNTSLLLVGKPGVDINQFPTHLRDITIECDVSGDPLMLDNDRINSDETGYNVSNSNKPAIFGFFGNLIKRKTNTETKTRASTLTTSKKEKDSYPDYDIL